ncbi:phage terminase large subunit [Candidatus Pacearchaeota archaeon]|nr:phage terminase large subunit [Candidatus Pacearchaeota archaeon]
MSEVNIEYVDKLHPIFTIPKRIKIIVGGRGSTKSTGIADYAAAQMTMGKLWCCAREHQNSIEESVHRTILEEIERLGMEGFEETKTSINHESGGRTFYRGLSRNITGLKSTLSGVDILWIEEGEDLTDNTLRVLTASVRLNATDTQRKMAGEDVKMPEIIITMNRGSQSGAVAKKWLARAEKELAKCGYYEDDLLMVVEMNYTDMPEDWFKLSGLEEERLDDLEKLSGLQYDHKWGGAYLEAVDNAIIQPEWFDAAIDAHIKLGFEGRGAIVATHDPSDNGEGADPRGYAARHGSVVIDVDENISKDVNDACDWATDKAIAVGADHFVWDCDGLGVTLKRQVKTALDGKKIEYHLFKGSEGVEDPNKIYQPNDESDRQKEKTNKESFKNKRAQYYIRLADRFYDTYRAVVKGEYIDPDTMISLSSEIKDMAGLRSEVCRIPLKDNGSGLIQILSKPEMKKLSIISPNRSDCLMMLMILPKAKKDTVVKNFLPRSKGW